MRTRWPTSCRKSQATCPPPTRPTRICCPTGCPWLSANDLSLGNSSNGDKMLSIMKAFSNNYENIIREDKPTSEGAKGFKPDLIGSNSNDTEEPTWVANNPSTPLHQARPIGNHIYKGVERAMASRMARQCASQARRRPSQRCF